MQETPVPSQSGAVLPEPRDIGDQGSNVDGLGGPPTPVPSAVPATPLASVPATPVVDDTLVVPTPPASPEDDDALPSGSLSKPKMTRQACWAGKGLGGIRFKTFSFSGQWCWIKTKFNTFSFSGVGLINLFLLRRRAWQLLLCNVFAGCVPSKKRGKLWKSQSGFERSTKVVAKTRLRRFTWMPTGLRPGLVKILYAVKTQHKCWTYPKHFFTREIDSKLSSIRSW